MNIYVGNLSLEMTEDELRTEFSKFGEVISVTIMNDKYIGSGQPRGYGYVEMASKSAGMIAIAKLERKIIEGRVISVVEALPLSDKHSNSIPNTKYKNKNRSHRNRDRKNQMV